MHKPVQQRLFEPHRVKRAKFLTTVATYTLVLRYVCFAFLYRDCLCGAVTSALSATATDVFVYLHLFCEVLLGKFLHPLGHIEEGIGACHGRDVEVRHLCRLPSLEVEVYRRQVTADKSALFRHLQQRHFKGVGKQAYRHHVQCVGVCACH